VSALLAFRPNLVIAVGTDEIFTDIIRDTETQWPSSAPNKPYWWMPEPEFNPQEGGVLANDPGLSKRLGAFSPGPNEQFDPLLREFEIRYASVFGGSPDPYAAYGYDAAYLISLAVVSNGAGDLTGSNLSAQFANLLPAPGRQRVDFGPSNINALVTAVANGGVDVNGVTGTLDFDPKTGDVPQDVQFACVQGNTFANSGAYYDAATKSAVGTFVCP
jgi:hypothetical protein